MNVAYRLQGIEFEWDSDKARSHKAKHGIGFEERVNYDHHHPTWAYEVAEPKTADTDEALA